MCEIWLKDLYRMRNNQKMLQVHDKFVRMKFVNVNVFV